MASVVHLDIKPENILVGIDEVAKFGDFGVSRVFNKKTEWLSQAQGTRPYHAPEVWTEKTFKAPPLDIWALGVTFFYLATGKLPFMAMDFKKLKTLIVETNPEFPSWMSEGLLDVLTRCLDKNPSTRADLQELLTHPWITSNGSNPLPQLELDKIEISKEDLAKALTKICLETNFFALTSMKKKMIQQRQKSSSKVNKKRRKSFTKVQDVLKVNTAVRTISCKISPADLELDD